MLYYQLDNNNAQLADPALQNILSMIPDIMKKVIQFKKYHR